jgi:hypothetical protein
MNVPLQVVRDQLSRKAFERRDQVDKATRRTAYGKLIIESNAIDVVPGSPRIPASVTASKMRSLGRQSQ